MWRCPDRAPARRRMHPVEPLRGLRQSRGRFRGSRRRASASDESCTAVTCSRSLRHAARSAPNGRRGPTIGRFARPRVEVVCRLRRSGVQVRSARAAVGPIVPFRDQLVALKPATGAAVYASSSTRTSSRIATSSRPRAQDEVHPPRACGGNAWDAQSLQLAFCLTVLHGRRRRARPERRPLVGRPLPRGLDPVDGDRLRESACRCLW